MFQSFFPQPKMFFSSLVIWCALLILVWYSFGQTIGSHWLIIRKEQVIGLGHFITSEFLWFDTFFAFGTIAFLVWRSRSHMSGDMVCLGLSAFNLSVICIRTGISCNKRLVWSLLQ